MSDAPSDPQQTPRALVAGHGTFAAGLVSAVEQITGRGAMLVPVAVTGMGADDIEQTLRTLMTDAGVHVIFTDLQAGSCSMAARRLLRGVPNAILISGTNLPVLLDFVFADDLPPADAARRAAERGRQAIGIAGAGG